MSKKAVVFLAEGFEEIEAVTVVDVLRRAKVDVITVGLQSPVVGSRALKVVPDMEIADLPGDADAYILPGGMPGAANLASSNQVGKLITAAAKTGKIIAAICASPAVILGPLGLLTGKKVTCYPGMENKLPADAVMISDDVVVDGNIITSRGPATALFFALMLVEKLAGTDTAREVKNAVLANSLSRAT